MSPSTRLVRLWATVLISSLAACKTPNSSQLRDVNQQKPFVDGGESGSYFESMHSILADQIGLLVELKKKHTALFGAAQSGQLPTQIATFKADVKTLQGGIQLLSDSFSERLASYRQDAASSDSVSAVEFEIATNHLKNALKQIAQDVPPLLDQMNAPATFHKGWQKTLDLLGRPVASESPKAIGGYLVSVERYLVKWQNEVTGTTPGPDAGPIVVPKLATLDACPVSFTQPNLANLPVVSSDPAAISPQHLCYDFAVGLAKLLEADASLKNTFKALIPKGLSINVIASGNAAFDPLVGMELTLPVQITSQTIAQVKPKLAQAVNLNTIRIAGNNAVEILNANEWRGICDDNFDANDGKVVCRMLNKTFVSFQAANGNGLFWLDDLGCTGDEASVFECTAAPLGQHNCGAGEHVAIVCQ